MAIEVGAFVLTNLPFGPPGRPDVPGPKPHIGYCLAIRNNGQGTELILAYTSSGAWRPAGQSVPIGVIEFDREAARALKQIPFYIDLRILARIPLSRAWLPRLGAPDDGVIAIAGIVLRKRIATEAETSAARRSEVIQVRGVRR